MEEMSIKPQYTYKASVVKVVDGDTLDVVIDLGFFVSVKQRVRLDGINTPETRTKNLREKELGLKAKQLVKDKVEGKDITVRVYKKGKFGRYLCDVILEDETILNNLLVERKLAKEYHGESRKNIKW